TLLEIYDEMKKAARPRGLSEPEDTLQLCKMKAFQLAQARNTAIVNPLFLLDAILRVRRSLAYQAIERSGLNLSQLRTRLTTSQANLRVARTIENVSEDEALEERRSDEEAELLRTGDGGNGAVSPGLAEPLAETTVVPVPVPPSDRRPLAVPPGPAADREPPEAGAFALDEDRFPLLVTMTENLTLKAARGEIDPVIGRDHEIRQVIRTLLKRRTNNPCLVGEPGVGKTALVEGLAREIAERSPQTGPLHDRIILSLQTSSLVAGTSLRGSFSERMIQLRQEVKRGEGRFIVFIDEIHTMVGAGAGEGALDAANELKAALSRGEFPCIGATTLKEYKRHIESDPALERRFQPIVVNEPSPDEAREILRGVLPFYEDHHRVRYGERAVDASVRLTVRYVQDRFLPDKALEVLDFAGASCRTDGRDEVTEEDIAAVVSAKVGVPVEKLLLSATTRYRYLLSFLRERVVGQDPRLERLAEGLKRGLAGLGGDRPLASFLLAGPPGTGRAETARALSEFLFDDGTGIRIFEGVEYTEAHAVAKLVGTSPGYIGFEQGGQLTEAMYRRPFQILLFRDVSRAHHEVQDLLRRLVSTGRVVDGKGRTVAFSNAVLIFTVDVDPGLLAAGGGPSMGFAPRPAGTEEEASDKAWERLGAAVPQALRREVDAALLYRPLDREQAVEVARRMVRKLGDRLLAEKDIGVTLSEEALALLVARGGHRPEEGARPMARLLQAEVENRVAELVLSGEARRGSRITVIEEDGRFRFVVRP
ncbi:MAG: ATP-dependent Clp protease ATP-binding subunit, partial [Deltaproteobacteria bacterium]|nr:ATP-dependent Clp protease ATP-binding subunit [Deltaproteobacteria bacterium]